MSKPDLSQIKADLAKLPKADGVKGFGLVEAFIDDLSEKYMMSIPDAGVSSKYFEAGKAYAKQYTPSGGPLPYQSKQGVEAALVQALKHLQGAVQQPGTVDSMLVAGDTLTINYKLDLGGSFVDIEVRLTAKEVMK